LVIRVKQLRPVNLFITKKKYEKKRIIS